MASTRELFLTRDVVEILGISRRQLRYWSRTHFIQPSERTPGGHARYTFTDLVELKTAKRLIDSGVSVQRIRSSVRSLKRICPTVRRPLAELALVAHGGVVLAVRGDSAFDALSGQEWVFEAARFQHEVDAWKRSREAARIAREPQPARLDRVRDRTA